MAESVLPMFSSRSFIVSVDLLRASLVAQTVKNFPVMEEMYYARR